MLKPIILGLLMTASSVAGLAIADDAKPAEPKAEAAAAPAADAKGQEDPAFCAAPATAEHARPDNGDPCDEGRSGK